MESDKFKIGAASNGREMHYSVGIMVKYNGKYLLLDRANPPFGYAGPAGHVDKEEDPHAAALRELYEETGIELKKLELIDEEEVLWNYCHSGMTGHYWYLYKAELDSKIDVMGDREAKSLDWFSPEEIKKLELEPVWQYWFKKVGVI